MADDLLRILIVAAAAAVADISVVQEGVAFAPKSALEAQNRSIYHWLGFRAIVIHEDYSLSMQRI